MATSLGLEYHNIPTGITLPMRIDELLYLRDLIDHAPKPLLIHCKAGADRTGLAGVMTKLLDNSSSPEEARAQVSILYHAMRSDSMGIPFLNLYTSWLNATGNKHSRDRFNQWLENEYIDRSGNIHYLVNPIEGQVWERPWGLIDEGRVFEVKRSNTDTLDLSGWAFDTRNTSLLEGLDVYLGNVPLKNSDYGIHQPWLIEDFGKQEYLNSGWTASQSLQAFADGCHDLFITFKRLDGSRWTTPAAARICIR